MVAMTLRLIIALSCSGVMLVHRLDRMGGSPETAPSLCCVDGDGAVIVATVVAFCSFRLI